MSGWNVAVAKEHGIILAMRWVARECGFRLGDEMPVWMVIMRTRGRR